MPAFRFRLGELVLVIVYLSLIFSAVRAVAPTTTMSPEFWAKLGGFAMTAVILGMLCSSIPAICTRRGSARGFWIGFASFGWAFFLIGFAQFLVGQLATQSTFMVRVGRGLLVFHGEESLWFTLLCTPLFAHVGGRIGQWMAGDRDEQGDGLSRSGR
ncbi:hypothetical protein [Tautonia plasticadhaerens]|uniref:Uncharacterized protein n=1 Tax=Tautonia plasticadhaerens TaxID=2527974 RepID=A0A518HBL5_9BACT|nr:hypothetical protein [Tautonia plasticadhaerens]QDV38248.1 hypothetical protein ElP_61990 [Tautonia plasticadhaerens]